MPKLFNLNPVGKAHYGPKAVQATYNSWSQIVIPWFLIEENLEKHFEVIIRETNVYGTYELGGEVDPDLLYRYPEDPPLHPVFILEREDPEDQPQQRLIVYPHDICAVQSGGKTTLITRLD